jgi:hypothetical protein
MALGGDSATPPKGQSDKKDVLTLEGGLTTPLAKLGVAGHPMWPKSYPYIFFLKKKSLKIKQN